MAHAFVLENGMVMTGWGYKDWIRNQAKIQKRRVEQFDDYFELAAVIGASYHFLDVFNDETSAYERRLAGMSGMIAADIISELEKSGKYVKHTHSGRFA